MNRPFVRSKQLKLRLKKYKEVKAAQARNPLLKARSGIPTLTREEHVHIMLQAWAELSPELGAKAWVAVKLMPYELAQQVGWTPKDAFADVRHCDYPWQAVSKIRPSEVDAEDMDAIEWDNVSMDFYVSKNMWRCMASLLRLSNQVKKLKNKIPLLLCLNCRAYRLNYWPLLKRLLQTHPQSRRTQSVCFHNRLSHLHPKHLLHPLQ